MAKGTSSILARVRASSVLPRTGRADEQDVGLLELDVVGAALLVARLQTLVVVVDGDGEHLLGVLLTDDVLVERRAISAGVGTSSCGAMPTDAILGFRRSSSARIVLQISTHSAQM
jgi:hypothetical protein